VQLEAAFNCYAKYAVAAHEKTRKTLQYHETVRTVLARMMHRQLAGAFDCYSGHVKVKKQQRKMARWRTLGVKKTFD